MMDFTLLAPSETRAEIADRIFGPRLMQEARTLSDNDPAFGKVAEKAVSRAVRRYQWLTRLGIYHKASNANWCTTAKEYAELRRRRAARDLVRKIARKHGPHGVALLYVLGLA